MGCCVEAVNKCPRLSQPRKAGGSCSQPPQSTPRVYHSGQSPGGERVKGGTSVHRASVCNGNAPNFACMGGQACVYLCFACAFGCPRASATRGRGTWSNMYTAVFWRPHFIRCGTPMGCCVEAVNKCPRLSWVGKAGGTCSQPPHSTPWVCHSG